MKQEIKQIIKRRFKRLIMYRNKRGKWFHAGTIHSFRLDIKKLRSLLVLVSADKGKITLPKPLKKLYRITGKIRLIQLQRKAIFKTTSKYHIPVPTKYLNRLENEKRELESESKYQIRKMKALNANKFSKAIPEKIEKETCRKYLSVQQNTLNELILSCSNDEQSLHQVRKILKAILDDLPYMKDKIKINPAFNHDMKNAMKTLESKIGEFHDISVSLQLLAEVLVSKYGDEENKTLISIRRQWQKDRDIQGQIDFSKLRNYGARKISIV
jgi:CHAD domain-containing protein